MTNFDCSATHAELVDGYGPTTARTVAKLIGEGFAIIATSLPARQVPITIIREDVVR